MNIRELSRKYKIDAKKLQYFADHQLMDKEQADNEESVKRLSLICTLYDMQLDAETIKKFLLLDHEKNYKEQIKLLNHHRHAVLEEIHEHQKSLDQLDYLVHKIKSKGRKTN